MKRWREFIVANAASLLLLLAVLLLGWREAAAFGLAVLVIVDLLVIARERFDRSNTDPWT